jgi:hypothetical protein
MKRFSMVLVLVILVGCMTMPKFRHSLDPDEQQATYIDEHDKSKNDAFVAAHAWIAKNFNSANDVIQMQDKDAGMIVVKAVFAYSYTLKDPFVTMPMSGLLNYTLSLQVKDQKMKMEFLTGNADSYLPKDDLNLIAHYKHIHDDLLNAVRAKSVDF